MIDLCASDIVLILPFLVVASLIAAIALALVITLIGTALDEFGKMIGLDDD